MLHNFSEIQLTAGVEEGGQSSWLRAGAVRRKSYRSPELFKYVSQRTSIQLSRTGWIRAAVSTGHGERVPKPFAEQVKHKTSFDLFPFRR